MKTIYDYPWYGPYFWLKHQFGVGERCANFRFRRQFMRTQHHFGGGDDYLPSGRCLLDARELPEHDDVDRGDGLPWCLRKRSFRGWWHQRGWGHELWR